MVSQIKFYDCVSSDLTHLLETKSSPSLMLLKRQWVLLKDKNDFCTMKYFVVNYKIWKFPGLFEFERYRIYSTSIVSDSFNVLRPSIEVWKRLEFCLAFLSGGSITVVRKSGRVFLTLLHKTSCQSPPRWPRTKDNMKTSEIIGFA